MTDLSKLRDELAERYSNDATPTHWTEQGDYFYYEDVTKAVQYGFDQALTALAAQSGEFEFNEKEVFSRVYAAVGAMKQISLGNTFPFEWYVSTFDANQLGTAMARTQFEQDKCTMAALMAKANGCAEGMLAAAQDIADLSAELAEKDALIEAYEKQARELMTAAKQEKARVEEYTEAQLWTAFAEALGVADAKGWKTGIAIVKSLRALTPQGGTHE